MPSDRARSRCGKKLSSPKLSGSRSGGEQATALEPRWSPDGARVTRGRRAVGLAQGRNIGRRQQGEVGGQLEHAGGAFCGQGAGAQGAGRCVALVGGLDQDAGAVVLGQAAGVWITGHDQDAGQAVARSEGGEDVGQHGAEQRLALLGGEDAGQALLGIPKILDRDHGPEGSIQGSAPSPEWMRWITSGARRATTPMRRGWGWPSGAARSRFRKIARSARP